jgi:hypothetical protein
MVRRAGRYCLNNAPGLLALFIALGGVSYAASGGLTSGGKLQGCVGANGALTLLKSAAKCHHGQQKVAWSQTGPRGPRGPAGASGAAGLNSGTGATIPAKVTSAETALTAATATNALSLGGVPASEFTRRDCASTTGQIKGFVTVPASPTFPSTLTAIGLEYNCSGKAVEARREGEGTYEVRFLGNPAEIAVATVNNSIGNVAAAFASVDPLAGGAWLVRVFSAEDNKDEDLSFSMILP